jgi:hypothetical protein
MKEVVITTEKIDFSTVEIPNCKLYGYNIVLLEERQTYRTDLLGYYHSYEPLFGVERSSPEFVTKKEAIEYAEKNWLLQQDLIKTAPIKHCTLGRFDVNDGWYYEIIHSRNKLTYRADLHGPDYDDFDWHYKDVELRKSSPEFATKEEVIEYVEREWVLRELVSKNKKIKNCVLGQPDANHGWQYKIMIIVDKLTYRADLYEPDYEGLDWSYSKEAVQKSSPEFSTEKEAVDYAEREWFFQEEEE